MRERGNPQNAFNESNKIEIKRKSTTFCLSHYSSKVGGCIQGIRRQDPKGPTQKHLVLSPYSPPVLHQKFRSAKKSGTCRKTARNELELSEVSVSPHPGVGIAHITAQGSSTPLSILGRGSGRLTCKEIRHLFATNSSTYFISTQVR